MSARPSAIAGLLGLAALAAHGAESSETDQIAQHSMIGLSEKRVLACLGEPARRRKVGMEEVWTFPIGQMRTEGGLLALGLNGYVSAFPASRPCQVKVVIDRYGVSQVFYADPDGDALPLGQQCLFPVEACVGD